MEQITNIFQSVPLPILILLIVVLLAVTIVIVYQYMKLKGLDGIREDVYQLILRAEHYFEHGDNAQKLKYVIQEARKLLPGWLQAVISEKTLENIVNLWFKGVKDLLDDGKVNGSQDTETKE